MSNLDERIDVHAGSWVIPTLVFITLGGAFCISLIDAPLITLHARIEAWATIVIALIVQAIPFLVLGILVSSVLSAFVPASVYQRFPRGVFGVPVAALAGMAIPACECASVPVGQSLMRRGVAPSHALVFLLASPAINPVVLVATAVAFNGNPMMVWARFAASLAAACVVGWIWMRVRFTIDGVADDACGHHHHRSWEAFRVTAVQDFLQACGFLVIGAAIAALIKVAVPESALSVVTGNVWLGVAMMVLLAVVMSLCSEADAFVATSFVGVSPIAQLAFMVVGPMVDIKLIFMQAGAFGWRFVLRFVPLVLVAAVFSAVGVGIALL